MVSIRQVYSYLVDTLEQDATLQGMSPNGVDVFALKAPEDHPTPFILLERQSGTHSYVMGAESIQRHWVFIKSITEGGDGGALGRGIMDRVHERLTGDLPTISGGYVARIQATTDLEYIEAETGNIQFFHVGTVFQFYLGNN